MTRQLSVKDVKAIVGSGQEFALVDVREQGEFSRSHQFLACCIPYGRIQALAPVLIPCKSAQVLLVDSGAGLFRRAERAARVLEAMGYADTAVMQGGLAAWEAEGYELFSGVNVVSKAFGEVVEIECRTPRLTPEKVSAMRERGEDMVVVDARPNEEYHNMCIPGGINAPGAELVLRIHDLAPDPGTRVIVNCAGRTRSIIGTQSLRNAGIPNPVSALKGGTMGWTLAGFELEYGQDRYSGPPSPEAVEKARDRVRAVARKFNVKTVDRDTLARWEAQAGEKTLYLLDVRQPGEYALGHYPGSRNAPGGQLVQATDEYAAVRNARYVLMDDNGVRATMTASWLNQMGYPHVHVLAGGLDGMASTTDTPGPELPAPAAGDAMDAQALKDLLQGSEPVAVLDVGCSKAYARAHVPGAAWVGRGRLSLAGSVVEHAAHVVVTANEEWMAASALADVRELWPGKSARALAGGAQAWIDAGFATEAGLERALGEVDDHWYKPYEDTAAKPEDMSGYLSWEVALVDKVERDGDAHFKVVN